MPTRYALDFLGISCPSTSWAGIQQILDGLLNWPLSLSLFLCAVLLFWAVLAALNSTDLKKR